MSREATYIAIAAMVIAVAWVVKYLWFPLRCPRCGKRAYTQPSDISRHLILRCTHCGKMSDLGELPDD